MRTSSIKLRRCGSRSKLCTSTSTDLGSTLWGSLLHNRIAYSWSDCKALSLSFKEASLHTCCVPITRAVCRAGSAWRQKCMNVHAAFLPYSAQNHESASAGVDSIHFFYLNWSPCIRKQFVGMIEWTELAGRCVAEIVMLVQGIAKTCTCCKIEDMPRVYRQESTQSIPTMPRSRKTSPASRGKKASDASLTEPRSRFSSVAPSVIPIALGMVGFDS